MKVMKFGGSSIASPERIRSVADIIAASAKKSKVIVVVSAFQGVTNLLIETAQFAERGDERYAGNLNALKKRHAAACGSLFGKRIPAEVRKRVDHRLDDLSNVLHGIFLLRDCPPRAFDLVMSFGERLSAFIIASYINRKQAAAYVDARRIIRTDNRYTNASIIFDETEQLIRKYFKEFPARAIPVVTGFIGSTSEGRTTTIGRSGSDYTASVIGAAMEASVVEIWTDVDGVMSSDPKIVPKAFVLEHISYEEAMELSYFGSKVLHPSTIAPAVKAKIPIRIKNSFNPQQRGTLVSGDVRDSAGAAKGISSVENVTLLTLKGMSMVGVPGTAERLFKALAVRNVNVILISQSSSEHTICFAINSNDAQRAQKAIAHEFRFEFQNRLTNLDMRDNQTIVAVVGQGMKGTPGIAGKIFQALGENNINVSAIAQGASELNISLVVDSVQKIRALNVIHQAFFEKRKRLALAVIGVGNIGSALLRQLYQQQSYLLREGFEVRVCCISNSRKFIFNPEGLDLTRWERDLQDSKHTTDVNEIVRQFNGIEYTNIAMIDCTASSEVVKAYPLFIGANMHIVTPNKKANVLPLKQYKKLLQTLSERQKIFLYEANIGAGLPIISTLKDLIASGDRIEKIEGIFSGTLSYLFNSYDGTQPFSELIREAHRMAYTEPDPREDLSGLDVARKLLILARQTGLDMELRDIKVKSLVPASLQRKSFSQDFFREYARFDQDMKRRYERARSKNAVLRYVATLEGHTAFAGPQEIPADHPFAGVRGSDNIIAFTTQRYSTTPLVVRGPGAGADVTAMGTFSDILKLLHYLPY
jgi:bifunctional aspartokinase / homoserine dehydrogenase 1